MDLLQTIYDNKINFPVFYERKIKITDPFTILYGPKYSGKTFLIYDYLNSNIQLNYLYIDLNDFRINDEIFNNLQQFIDKNNIKILVIENYTYNIKLPNVQSIILSTYIYNPIKKFKSLKIMPLDFEEYLLFDTKHQNTINSFNSFLKYGNIPELIEYKELKKLQRIQELLKLYTPNQKALEILKILIQSLGQIKSTYWLYNILKTKLKISKDKFYATVQEFEDSHTIIYCGKYLQPKATKKIFCFSHALIDAVTYKKQFINIFSNLIFLELFNKDENIFYLDGIDFYLPNKSEIILCTPFFNKITFSNTSKKLLKSLEFIECNSITIVTVSNYDTIYIDNIQCEVIPFYEWALSN